VHLGHPLGLVRVLLPFLRVGHSEGVRIGLDCGCRVAAVAEGGERALLAQVALAVGGGVDENDDRVASAYPRL
jgi:hypothetical protein